MEHFVTEDFLAGEINDAANLDLSASMEGSDLVFRAGPAHGGTAEDYGTTSPLSPAWRNLNKRRAEERGWMIPVADFDLLNAGYLVVSPSRLARGPEEDVPPWRASEARKAQREAAQALGLYGDIGQSILAYVWTQAVQSIRETG